MTCRVGVGVGLGRASRREPTPGRCVPARRVESDLHWRHLPVADPGTSSRMRISRRRPGGDRTGTTPTRVWTDSQPSTGRDAAGGGRSPTRDIDAERNPSRQRCRGSWDPETEVLCGDSIDECFPFSTWLSGAPSSLDLPCEIKSSASSWKRLFDVSWFPLKVLRGPDLLCHPHVDRRPQCFARTTERVVSWTGLPPGSGVLVPRQSAGRGTRYLVRRPSLDPVEADQDLQSLFSS